MYITNGKQVLFVQDGVTTSIAQADDNEKAHAIAHGMNGRSQNFVRQALVTCSPLFHGDMVSVPQFKGRLNGAIDALNKLDQVKKSLFYGRDNNLISDGQADVSHYPNTFAGTPSPVAIDIIHAILGMATEAGELLEALRDIINGHPVDWVNIKEELGDSFWYVALLANQGDFTFEEVQELIISKLAARFPDKFAAFNANNRNLTVERAILEGQPREIALQPVGIVSGKAAVEDATVLADNAFDAVKAAADPGVEAPATVGGNNDLSKGVGERLRPMPDEHLARQSVRREDI